MTRTVPPPCRITLEITVDSLEDAAAAAANGADRIELCDQLHTDGLTPGASMMRAMRAALRVPIVVMVRPRPGDYCYSESEIAAMRGQIEQAINHGADEIIFGCVTRDGEIDADACGPLLESCKGRPAVFHRVFDATPDPLAALDALLGLGFCRLLTAGHSQSAVSPAGMTGIAQLRHHARGRIEILPGGGVRPENVGELIMRTGCTQVHSSCRIKGAFAAAVVHELRRACDAAGRMAGMAVETLAP